MSRSRTLDASYLPLSSRRTRPIAHKTNAEYIKKKDLCKGSFCNFLIIFKNLVKIQGNQIFNFLSHKHRASTATYRHGEKKYRFCWRSRAALWLKNSKENPFDKNKISHIIAVEGVVETICSRNKLSLY